MSNYIKQIFENDQVLRAEQLNYIEKGIERAAKGTSFLSPSLTLEDSLVSCSPLENSLLGVTSYIEAVQEGSGDPYPAGGGKNLLPYPYLVPEGNYTSSNINFVIRKDGSILVKAGTTGDSRSSLIFTTTFNFIAGKTYYISGSQGSIQVVCSYKDESGKDRYYLGSSAPLTWQENYTFTYLYIQIDSNQTISSDTIIYPALYADKKEDTWTPYSNIRPITGWNAASVTRCGKNLLSKPFEIGVHRQEGHYPGTFGKTSVASTKAMLFKSGQYIFTGNIGAEYRMYINSMIDDTHTGTYQKWYNGAIFEIPQDGLYNIQLNMVNGVVIEEDMLNNLNATAQVNLGDVAMPYEPYQGNTYTAQFPETIYGGELDWETGVLTVTRGHIILTGGEDYRWSETKPWRVYIIANDLKYGDATKKYAISSHFKPNMNVWSSDMTGILTNTNAIYIGLEGAETRDAIVSYISEQYAAETPVTIVYELAEPYTIQLTPQQIEALKEANNLFSSTGKTKVTFQTDLTQTLNNQTLDLNNLGARITKLETAVINTL